MATATAERSALKEGTLGTLAGTGKLLRFQARRTRVYLVAWIAGLVGGTALVAASFPTIYATAEDRAQFGITADTPAMRAMTGPGEYIDAYAASTGAMFAHQMMLWMGGLTAVMFILLITRLTRADEETSRLEVIRSQPVGRRADLAAALLLSLFASMVLGLLLALAVSGMQGVTAEGALLYGLAHSAIGIAFAALAAVAAQLASYGSTSSGLAFGALGFAVLMSAVGSAQENWAIWLSPIGWSQETFMLTPDQRWWPLAVTAALAGLAVWLAFVLVTHRDFGGGLLPSRPGRAEAKPGLSGIGSLTFRLSRGLMLAGVITMLLLGAMYGSIIGSADEIDLPDVQMEILNRGGGTLEENFSATIAAIDGLFATLFGLLVVGRARKEETEGRGELLASAPVPRHGWPGSYLPAALVASGLAVAVGGLFFALTGAASMGDDTFIGKLLTASLIQLPAVWVVVAFAFAAFAWLPRAGWIRWLAWIYVFVATYYGELLDLPGWMLGISPFDYVSSYPAADIDWLPLVGLLAVAAALSALGYIGVRRRDLQFS